MLADFVLSIAYDFTPLRLHLGVVETVALSLTLVLWLVNVVVDRERPAHARPSRPGRWRRRPRRARSGASAAARARCYGKNGKPKASFATKKLAEKAIPRTSAGLRRVPLRRARLAPGPLGARRDRGHALTSSHELDDD